jgi:hypothetical protein
MSIEHVTDRNMTRTGLGAHRGMQKEPRVNELIDLQRALVADHITDLEREGAALRAERIRDCAAATPSSGTGASPRVRLGRWLVGVGQTIAGPGATTDAGDTLSRAA